MKEKDKVTIKKQDILPKDLCSKVVVGKITSDFVLSLYEKSKTQKGKRREDTLKVANALSKHVGKWVIQ